MMVQWNLDNFDRLDKKKKFLLSKIRVKEKILYAHKI